jgi:hypothetical protein
MIWSARRARRRAPGSADRSERGHRATVGREVRRETLGQRRNTRSITLRSIRPFISAVPLIFVRRTAVADVDVLMKMLNAGIDDRGVDVVHVELGAQSARGVPRCQTYRGCLSVGEAIEIDSMAASLDNQMAEDYRLLASEHVRDPDKLAVPHVRASEGPFAADLRTDRTCGAIHAAERSSAPIAAYRTAAYRADVSLRYIGLTI